MPEFVFLFRSTPEQQRAAMGTPEQAERAMKAWLDWVRELDANGHLKSPGQPLAVAGKVVRGPDAVTDGPYVEAKDLVLGFNVISARDIDEAVELAQRCPMVQGGGGLVEIRPVDLGVMDRLGPDHP